MKRLLIIVAFNEEFKILKGLLKKPKIQKDLPILTCDGDLGKTPVRVCMTAMGMDAARTATATALETGEFYGVLVLGYCGGLSLSLSLGDAVIPKRVISSQDGFSFEMDLAVNEDLGRVTIAEGVTYRAVPIITQPLVVETPVEKRELYAKTKAEAVDMEVSEVVRVVRRKGLPVAVVKIVVDDADTELPKFNEQFKKQGRVDQVSMAPLKLSQPSLSLRLKNNIKHGGEVLGKITPGLVQVVSKSWN